MYDDLNIQRCYECCDFGHKSKNCNNCEICHICSEKHDRSIKCIPGKVRCNNCIEYNEKYKSNFQINHAASDIAHCSVFNIKKDQVINKTDYPSSSLLLQ